MRCTKMSFALLCFILLSGCASSQTQAQYDKVGISSARSVRQALNDPDSFRVDAAWLVHGGKGDDPDTVWVCFKGRAKNEMGGYVTIIATAEGHTDSGKGVWTMISPLDGDRAKYIEEPVRSNPMDRRNGRCASSTQGRPRERARF
jgi:hypothetical protein